MSIKPTVSMAAAKQDARLLFQLCAAGAEDDAPDLVAVLERIDESVRAMTPAQERLFQNYTKMLEVAAANEDLAP